MMQKIRPILGNVKLNMEAGLVLFVNVAWVLVHEVMHSIPCFIWGYNVASISFWNSAQAVCGGIENSVNPLHIFTVGWTPYLFNIIVLYIFSKRDWNKVWQRAILHAAFFNSMSNLLMILLGRIVVDLYFIANPLGAVTATAAWTLTTILTLYLYLPQIRKTKYDPIMLLYLIVTFIALNIVS